MKRVLIIRLFSSSLHNEDLGGSIRRCMSPRIFSLTISRPLDPPTSAAIAAHRAWTRDGGRTSTVSHNDDDERIQFHDLISCRKTARFRRRRQLRPGMQDGRLDTRMVGSNHVDFNAVTAQQKALHVAQHHYSKSDPFCCCSSRKEETEECGITCVSNFA